MPAMRTLRHLQLLAALLVAAGSGLAAPINLLGPDGQPWLRDATFGARLADGTELASSGARYRLTRSDTGGRSTLAFADREGVLDLQATVRPAGPLAARVQLTLTNRSGRDLRLERLTVLSGLRPGTGTFGKLIPNGLHSWENPDIFRLLPGQAYDGSYWTLAVQEPALAAGFLTGVHNTDRFAVAAEAKGLRVTAWAECDGCVLPAGGTRVSDELFVSAGANPLAEMERFAGLAAEENQATLRFGSFATWCSWYAGWIRSGMYGYKQGLQKGVETNIPLVAHELGGRGAGWMRVVDDSDEMPYGDWDDATKALPLGFNHLIERMKARGVQPGIWLPLFMVSDRTRLNAEHPDWLCRDGTGNAAYSEFYGNRCGILDSSNPAVQEHLEGLGRSLRQRGFRYVMTDFLITAFGPPEQYDPTMTKVERHRAGLEAFRRGLGPDVYWLGCGAVLGPSMGLCDGLRISGDSFGNAPYAYLQSGSRWFWNHRTWLNDPDAIVCRGNDPEWNRGWMTWMALSGQVLTYGDTLDDMAPDNLATYKRVFPPVDVAGRPLDLWENSPYLLWGLRPDASTKVFGVFHFGGAGTEDRVTLNLDEVSARIDSWTVKPATAPRRWLLWDFWGERLLEADGPTLELPVPSNGGQLFALREALDRPQLLGTTGHFTMGALEVSGLRWDAGNGRLHALVRGNAGDPTTVFLHVPEGFGVDSATLGGGLVSPSWRENRVLAVDVPATTEPLGLSVRFTGHALRAEGRRPFAGGNPAQWDPSQPRRRALEQAAPEGYRLAAYLDCPGMSEDGPAAGPVLRQLVGKPYSFPASGGAAAYYCSILFDEAAVAFELRGLDPAKRYQLGFSWWDENADRRVESVTLVTADGVRYPLLEKAALPAYQGDGKMPEERLLEIPSVALGHGPVEVLIANEANVPNAVISEVWLLEGDPR